MRITLLSTVLSLHGDVLPFYNGINITLLHALCVSSFNSSKMIFQTED